MQQMTYSEVRQNLSQVLNETQNGPIAVTRNGKPAAVILGHDDFMQYQEYKQQQLRQEFDRLMERHNDQIQALADK